MFIYTLGKHVTSTEFPEVRYVRVSSCMAGIHRCPVSSARSVQKFGGMKKKKKNVKKEMVTVTMMLFLHANSRLYLGTLSHLAP